MAYPATAQPLAYRMTPPLGKTVSDSDALSDQLEALWHYDCVVSPPSRVASLPCIPHQYFSSSAANLDAAASTCSTSVSHVAAPHISWGSHEASLSSSSSSSHPQSPVCQGNGHHQNPHLQRVFNTFDEDGDGTVSIHEISKIFEKLGIECSTESLLAGLVTKSPGYVDDQEFLSLYESVCFSDSSASSSDLHADVDQDLLAAFHVFDKDGNGFISPAELQSVLCSLGFPQGRQLEDCVDMIARVDENKDGHVDFSEFKKLFLAENPFITITSY